MTDRDDLAAPAYDPGAADLSWWRRGLAQGLGYYLPSGLFVMIPLFFAVSQPWPVMLALVALSLVVAALFLGTTLVMHWPEWARWCWVLALVVAIWVLGVVSGGESRPIYFAPYVTCATAGLIAWRHARVLIPVVSLVAVGLALLDRDTFGVIMAIVAVALGLSIGMGIETERVREALRRSEERTAVLAVAAERERIGRDLHDILGHSLTTIAVKADLAGRLVGRSDEAARAEIDSLATIARQALADVRSTASGMREVRLASEVASARSVLQAAGLECRAPSALPLLDDAASELFGFMVREAVTNVIRHAGASVCTIEASEGSITVSDDGRGMGRPALQSGGTGLAGLRARLQDAGGDLDVASDETGTRVRARLRDKANREGTP